MTKELGLKQALHEVLAPDYTSIIQDASAGLVKAIQNDTVTVEQIDSFLQETLVLLPESKQQRAHVFLLSKKAWLVSQAEESGVLLTTFDREMQRRSPRASQ